MLVLHKVANPLVLIYYVDTTNRVWVHWTGRTLILSVRGYLIVLTEVVRDEFLQTERMNFRCIVTL